MATKRFRDGAWRYRVTRKKVLAKPAYFTFDDEEEGDAYCQRLEELLDKGIIPDGLIAGDTQTLGQTINEYLSRNSVKIDDSQILALIQENYHNLPIDRITYTWIENWVSVMKRERHLAPGTIRHYVGALARCLDWAVAKEYLVFNSLRQLPKGYAQYTAADAKYVKPRHDIEMDRRLEDGEEERIRAAIDSPEMLLLFDLALETAMRLSEIYPLEWSQIDLIRRTIYLEKTKNGSKRQVPLSSVALKLLKDVSPKQGPLFSFGGKSRITSARLSKQWARLFESVDAKELRFHCLRHEAISRLFERTNLPSFVIAKIAGHSSDRMLSRYANLRASNIADDLW